MTKTRVSRELLFIVALAAALSCVGPGSLVWAGGLDRPDAGRSAQRLETGSRYPVGQAVRKGDIPRACDLAYQHYHDRPLVADRYRFRYLPEDSAVWAWFHSPALIGCLDLYELTSDHVWLARARSVAEKFFTTRENAGLSGPRLESSGYQRHLIPNSSFEKWSGGNPVGWTFDNQTTARKAPAEGEYFKDVIYSMGRKKYRHGKYGLLLSSESGPGLSAPLKPEAFERGGAIVFYTHAPGARIEVSVEAGGRGLFFAKAKAPAQGDYVVLRVPEINPGNDRRLRLRFRNCRNAFLDDFRVSGFRGFPVHAAKIASSMYRLYPHLDKNDALRHQIDRLFVPLLKDIINLYYLSFKGGATLLDPLKGGEYDLPLNRIASMAQALMVAGRARQDQRILAQGDRLLKTVAGVVSRRLAEQGYWFYRESLRPGSAIKKSRPDDLGHAGGVVAALCYWEEFHGRKTLAPRLAALFEKLVQEKDQSGRFGFKSHIDWNHQGKDRGTVFVSGWLPAFRHANVKKRGLAFGWCSRALLGRVDYDLSHFQHGSLYLQLLAQLAVIRPE